MYLNNTKYEIHSQQLILIALSDEQWHRYKDLVEKTKLSRRTLSKHLPRLEKTTWIEKRIDKESGQYPYPVLYRITNAIAPYATYLKNCSKIAKTIETQIKKNKDPLQIIERVHKANLLFIASTLQKIQNEKIVSKKQIDWMSNLYLFAPYQVYIQTLLETFIDEVQFGAPFDFKQLREKWQIPDGDFILFAF